MPQHETTTAPASQASARACGKRDSAFKSHAAGRDLKRKSVRSGAVTIASQAAQFVIQTASTAVLARLLAPRDFGIMAMALSMTAFARIFKDAGLSSASIQRKDLTHAQVSALFWVNVLVGILITVVVVAAAPLMVWFYQKPEVFWATIVLGTTFAIGSFGIQHTALLNREMRFRTLAIIRIASLAAGAFASILLALFHFTYWALVWGLVVNSAVNVVLLWSLSNWRPTRPARAQGLRTMFHFGANVTGFNFANYFSRNLDNILIGRVCGAGSLGLYSKAYAILMLPINNLRNPLTGVAFAAMSRLQDDARRFRAYLRRYISVLAFASMPLAALLFVCSDNVINILLGPRWIGASSIFRLLALAAFIQPSISIRGLVMLSTGQSKRYLGWGLWGAAAIALSFGIGIFWGPNGVALSYSVVNYLIIYPSLQYAFKGTPVRLIDFFSSIAKPAAASLAATGVTLLLKNAILWHHDISALAACGTLFSVTYGLVFWLLPGGPSELREYSSYVRMVCCRATQKRPVNAETVVQSRMAEN